MAPLTGFTLHSGPILELEMDKMCALGYGICKLGHLKIYEVDSMSVYDMDDDQIELTSGSYPGKIQSRETPNGQTPNTYLGMTCF